MLFNISYLHSHKKQLIFYINIKKVLCFCLQAAFTFGRTGERTSLFTMAIRMQPYLQMRYLSNQFKSPLQNA